jgi:hypothetical protein
MMLDQFNNHGNGYPSYAKSYQPSGEKTWQDPPSDTSTADSRGAIPLDHFRNDYAPEIPRQEYKSDVPRQEYASDWVDSRYMMQQGEAQRAQMAVISQYMQAAYGQQLQAAYGQPPPTSHPGRADALPRNAEYSSRDPRASYAQQPGAPAPMFIPQFMPAPMPVPFQVPPGYMLVPADESEQPRSNPKPYHDQSRSAPRNRPRHQRKTSDKVSKIFVGGLSPVTTVDNLRAHFGKYGEIVDAAVILEPATRKSRGFGYVEFIDGIPEGLLDIEHYVDSRRCGVRAYQYNPEAKD